MRRWLLACLALVAAAAVVLWQRGGSSVGSVGIATVPEGARVVSPSAHTEDVEALASRVAAQAAPTMTAVPDAPAPAPAVLSTRLSVQVLDPGGRPWAGGTLKLWTFSELERTPFDQDRQRGFARDTPRGPRYLTFLQSDDDGRVVIDGIKAGEDFELDCIDGLDNVGGTLEGVALDPSEAREVVLRLDRVPTRVEGRCIDAQGLPLERVRVTLVRGAPRLECETDAEGRFATVELFGDEVELEFRRRGMAVQRERVLLPPPTPFDVVLSSARILTVNLVDESGRPFALNGLRARAADGHTLVDTHPERREGDFLFEFMPRTALTLEIVDCGTDATLDVDADTELVRWTLPRPGRFEIARGRPPPDFPPFPMVEVRRSDSGELVFSHRLITNQLHSPQGWTLFPGKYTLQFFITPDLQGSEPAAYGPQRTIEIWPGGTVTMTLGD